MKGFNIKNNARAVLGLSFLFPTAVMFVIFIVRGIYPFGDNSFLFGDLYHQYMPFFSELTRKAGAGESLGFSYHVGIGSNFLALYVYYLASPLNLFALLVPEGFLIEFISYLVVLKIGLAGLSCCYYLQKHFGTESFAALFFSGFYALSGFMAAYNYNIMWVDCVVLLPLIALGLERLVKEGRYGLYCVTLALSILTNYYISIMICIFLVLYFILLLVTERGKNLVRSLWQFALFSLLAGSMAAVLLIPEVCAILQTDFGDMDFPEKTESYFSVLDMLARHCMCVYTERGLDHWPNIYCGSAVLMLLPMYAVNRKISIRERFCRLALLGIMLLGFSTNILDFMWHGLNYPDSLPARQSFIYIFLVLTACCEAFLHVREVEKEQILYGYLGATVFLLFCEKFVEHEDFEPGVKLLTLLFITFYAVCLYLYRTRHRERTAWILAMLVLMAVTAECSINTINTSVGTVSRSAYLDPQEDYRILYETAVERQEGFFRVEKFTRRTKNDATLAGYPSASVFSSTMNSQVMDMYRRLGMRHSKVFYGFDGATALTAALLNVNYMFGEDDSYENSLYEPAGQSGDVFLYESKRTLPFGYVAPLGYDLPEGYDHNGIALQNQMVRELGVEGRLFSEEQKVQSSGEHVRLTASEPGIYYALVTVAGISKAEALGVSSGTWEYGDLSRGSVLYLGYLEQGQTVTLRNADEGEEVKAMAADVYRMDEKVLEEALEKLSETCLEQVTVTSDRLSGRITMKEEGRLILSVPREDGWRILVNGQEREADLFGGCLVAFDLQPGEYEIDMRYVPQGQWAGAAVSGAGILLFALCMFFSNQKKKAA